jgi:pimeloyl-ACP methyl ester carboxylesterase
MQLNVQGHSCFVSCGSGGDDALDPALPAIVLVHGAQLDHAAWDMQSGSLARHGFAVLAVDLPGHGRNAAMATLPSIEAMADWIIAVLDAAGVRSTTFAGHSMGSLVALECAARHPGRVDGIALLATAFPLRVAQSLLDATRQDEPGAMAKINVWSHSKGAAQSAAAEANLRTMQRQKPGVLHHDFSICNDYAAGLASAAAVRCPALLICGERDIMTPPKAAAEIGTALGNSRTITIPGAGHNLMGEAPDAVTDALVSFMTESRKATT